MIPVSCLVVSMFSSILHFWQCYKEAWSMCRLSHLGVVFVQVGLRRVSGFHADSGSEMLAWRRLYAATPKSLAPQTATVNSLCSPLLGHSRTKCICLMPCFLSHTLHLQAPSNLHCAGLSQTVLHVPSLDELRLFTVYGKGPRQLARAVELPSENMKARIRLKTNPRDTSDPNYKKSPQGTRYSK